jgi:hypothetical protein
MTCIGKIFSALLLLLPASRLVLGADQTAVVPDWLSRFPQATDQLKGGWAPFSDYITAAPTTSVISYYRDQLTKAGVVFQVNFDGVGTSIRAAAEGTSCVVRIRGIDSGAEVTTHCGFDPSASGRLSAPQVSEQPATASSPPTTPSATPVGTAFSQTGPTQPTADSPTSPGTAPTVAGDKKIVHVRQYTRKDGTVVKAHDRTAPRTQ